MKIIIGLVVLVVVGVVVVTLAGGLVGFDPAEEAKQFTATVKRGMSWRDVVDVKEPAKLMVGDSAQPVAFHRSNFEARFKQAKYLEGFRFPYAFTEDHLYVVEFDSTGTVIDVRKDETFKNLLDGQPFKKP